MNLHRIRWAVRAVGGLAIAVSVFANILHAEDNPVSQGIAAWPPIALVLTVELISRVPVQTPKVAWVRRAATTVIAGIAAWVSYWHMAAVASRYGETGASPYLLPLSVDGLVVVSFICLVELGGRIAAASEVSAAVPAVRFDYPRPIGPEPAPQQDRVSAPDSRARKPQPSSRERVERAHKRNPAATHEQLAKHLELSTKTVQRWRPARVEETPVPVDKVNGREPQFAAAD